ncbi:VOC family protein [Pollutimonas bauzanensis]|uniref:VOC domain-containing protein n=1 Tax=Pollutimonas bauzanensis TaxID=658167 RepID=A0A1M5NHS5_9BURK|nr:VOC family protein [Pollutimonas bauzanensis]SHG89078.1 hypothetical protein SAMN04488135_101532 [Pollutimonas bauzanensis]
MPSFFLDYVQIPFLRDHAEDVRAFYRKVIGLCEINTDHDHKIRFSLGNANIALTPVDSVEDTVRADYLAIKTQSFDAIFERLTAAGYFPVCARRSATERVMYIKDPSGNQLALLDA